MAGSMFTVGTVIGQTAVAGVLSLASAQYGNSRFKILRFPNTTTETAAFVLGVSAAAAQFLLGKVGELLFKEAPSFMKNYALSTALSGSVFAALAYSGEFVDLTGKELACIFAIGSIAHFIFKSFHDKAFDATTGASDNKKGKEGQKVKKAEVPTVGKEIVGKKEDNETSDVTTGAPDNKKGAEEVERHPSIRELRQQGIQKLTTPSSSPTKRNTEEIALQNWLNDQVCHYSFQIDSLAFDQKFPVCRLMSALADGFEGGFYAENILKPDLVQKVKVRKFRRESAEMFDSITKKAAEILNLSLKKRFDLLDVSSSDRLKGLLKRVKQDHFDNQPKSGL